MTRCCTLLLFGLPASLRTISVRSLTSAYGADARTRTGNRSITSRVRYQLRHAGNVQW
jgi:hypothetical protein